MLQISKETKRRHSIKFLNSPQPPERYLSITSSIILKNKPPTKVRHLIQDFVLVQLYYCISTPIWGLVWHTKYQYVSPYHVPVPNRYDIVCSILSDLIQYGIPRLLQKSPDPSKITISSSYQKVLMLSNMIYQKMCCLYSHHIAHKVRLPRQIVT